MMAEELQLLPEGVLALKETESILSDLLGQQHSCALKQHQVSAEVKESKLHVFLQIIVVEFLALKT